MQYGVQYGEPIMSRHCNIRALAVLCTGLLLACAGPGTRSDTHKTADVKPQTAASTPLPVMHRDDTLWLERVTFGFDSASVEEYRRLGRRRFLDHQLDDPDPTLPAPLD